jgi:hypothetical protein
MLAVIELSISGHLPRQFHFLAQYIDVYENVSWIKYLGMTVTNQNFIQDEIMMKMNSGTACFQS